MEIINITAAHLKTAALSKLCFKYQCHCVATEVGPYNADVMGINQKIVYEIETKITKSDLRNDFNKIKHIQYVQKVEGLMWMIPHKFFFAVPNDLAKYAVELCQQHQDNYGVMSFHPGTCILKTVKHAKFLHDNRPSYKINVTVLKRMSSELCRFHIAKMNDSRFEMIGD